MCFAIASLLLFGTLSMFCVHYAKPSVTKFWSMTVHKVTLFFLCALTFLQKILPFLFSLIWNCALSTWAPNMYLFCFAPYLIYHHRLLVISILLQDVSFPPKILRHLSVSFNLHCLMLLLSNNTFNRPLKKGTYISDTYIYIISSNVM